MGSRGPLTCAVCRAGCTGVRRDRDGEPLCNPCGNRRRAPVGAVALEPPAWIPADLRWVWRKHVLGDRHAWRPS